MRPIVAHPLGEHNRRHFYNKTGNTKGEPRTTTSNRGPTARSHLLCRSCSSAGVSLTPSDKRQTTQRCRDPARTHARTHTHTRRHARTHVHARTRTHTHVHARTRTHTHTRARTHTHAHTHTHTHTPARTHARTHTHTVAIFLTAISTTCVFPLIYSAGLAPIRAHLFAGSLIKHKDACLNRAAQAGRGTSGTSRTSWVNT